MSTAHCRRHTHDQIPLDRKNTLFIKLNTLRIESSSSFRQSREALIEESTPNASRPVVRLPPGVASTLKALFKMPSVTASDQNATVFGVAAMCPQSGFTGFGSQGDSTPRVVMPTAPMTAETAKSAFGRACPAQTGAEGIVESVVYKDITLEASDATVFTAHKPIIFQSSDWMKSKWEAEETLKLDYPTDVIESLLRHAYGLYVGMLHDPLPALTSEAAHGSDAKQDSIAAQNIETVQQLLAAASKYGMKDLTTAAGQRLLQLLDCCDDRPGLIITVASSICSSGSDEQTRQHAAKAVVRVLQDVMSEEKNEAVPMANAKLARDVMFYAGQNLKATTASRRAPKSDFGVSFASTTGASSGSPFSTMDNMAAKAKTKTAAGGVFDLPPDTALPQFGSAASFGFRVGNTQEPSPANAENSAIDFQWARREPGLQFGQLGSSMSFTPPAFWGATGPNVLGVPQKNKTAPAQIFRHPLCTAQSQAMSVPPMDTSGKPVGEYFGGMSQARLKRLAETDGAEDVEKKKPKMDGP
ncbi:hypothetical protein B0A48_15055 [Cryoendolithus antarcticus]|uniref:BTB domain-containing protein n=1 Tax=Cryoendolithus antarcticus TaxID=1507870 RepID=A0A1V8SJ89_9PEZI|nr:hypothetical protein B0A48_15055 [Cryoendolithus antarcticus]